jgi:hypothetical protein
MTLGLAISRHPGIVGITPEKRGNLRYDLRRRRDRILGHKQTGSANCPCVATCAPLDGAIFYAGFFPTLMTRKYSAENELGGIGGLFLRCGGISDSIVFTEKGSHVRGDLSKREPRQGGSRLLLPARFPPPSHNGRNVPITGISVFASVRARCAE